jgi:hypothetical protein
MQCVAMLLLALAVTLQTSGLCVVLFPPTACGPHPRMY